VVKEIRKTIGFGRVLFATDYPGPLSAGVSIASIVKSLKSNKHLTDREKCKVLGRNGLRLLGRGSSVFRERPRRTAWSR
jgi:predicted TIM-barrel fold metal-dependent hydrolase